MKMIHVRFADEELHKAIKKTAESNRRSLNNEVLRAIEFYLKHGPEAQEVKLKKEVKKKSKSPQ